MPAVRRRPSPVDAHGVGPMLRTWRERRRMSQLELSLRAQVSTRHLSFVETGRSRPTSDMIMRVTEHLDVPLRERNTLLLAGGFAPAYPQRGLDDPSLHAISDALRRLLDAHRPYPAVVVDRVWTLVDANAAVGVLTEGCAAELLEPPVNVLRLSLHPDGMAPRIGNLGQWRAHVLERLRRQAEATADGELYRLLNELRGYPGNDGTPSPEPAEVVVPLRYRWRGTELSLLSTTSVFGTPRDVTVSELAVEAFFPTDAATTSALLDAGEVSE